MSLSRLTVDQTSGIARPGVIASLGARSIITLPNASGSLALVQTITPGVATQEITTYRLTEQNTLRSVSFVSDATPTAAEVVTGLKAALALDPVLSGLAVYTGSTTLVATARSTGTSAPKFNFADGGSTPTNVLTVANTTASSNGAKIPYGRAITGGSDGKGGLIAATLSASNILRGFSVFGYFGDQDDLTDIDGIPPFSPVPVLQAGDIYVRSLTAWNPTSQVWLMFSGTNAGMLRATDSGNSDNVRLFTGIQFLDVGAAAGIAKISLNLPSYTLS